MEATVERCAIPLTSAEVPISLDIRLQLGRCWLKLLPASAREKFKAYEPYQITKPDPTNKADAAICAHPEAWQQFQAVAGRAIDGIKIYLHLKKNLSHSAFDSITSLTDPEKKEIDNQGPKFMAWFEKLYLQPEVNQTDAWQPERLEYQFNCAVPNGEGGEKVLSAEEYYQRRLDWYSFDWDKSRSSLGTSDQEILPKPVEKKYTTQSFIPTPVRFNGMPDTRWWAFEDGRPISEISSLGPQSWQSYY